MQGIKSERKYGYIITGIVIILLALYSNYGYIFDWSTPELVGYNFWAILLTLVGIFLIYKGFKKKMS